MVFCDILRPDENNINKDCGWGWCCGNNRWFELPDYVLVEILCGLPEKPLIRFKCVSKSWNTLITNVCIPKLSNTAPLCGFLFRSKRVQDREDEIQYASITDAGYGFVGSCKALLPFEPAPVDWLDCCNGLLLFVRGSTPQYYVCNPATEQCVEIPRDVAHSKAFYAALAFNPCTSPHYKVVRMAYTLGSSVNNPPRLDIFSSDTGKWVVREVPIEAPVYGVSWIKRSVYLDGVLYRLSRSMHLLCFDLNAVNDCAIVLPEKERMKHMGFIGASRGRLYYATHDGSNFHFWLLEDHSKKIGVPWILKHTISINNLARDPLGNILCLFRSFETFMPYALHPTSEVVFLGSPVLIVCYHSEGSRLKQVCGLKFPKSIIWGQYTVYPYSRCLVSLKDFVPRHNGSNQLISDRWLKLPDDVVVEILCRLPEKPLIRFKCVSKSWNTLITNVCIPKLSTTAPLCGFLFRSKRLHQREHEIQYASITDVANGFVESCKALLPFKPAPIDWLDCCNGLLLFVRGSTPQYYVCNPATEQCVEIPRDVAHSKAFYAALAFNPCKSPHYKVVRMAYTLGSSVNNPPRLDIFSSDTGKWITREVPIEAPVYGVSWIKRSVYLDGVLYRLSCSMHLLCFDLNAVNDCAIVLPEKERMKHMGFIGASRGHLYYATHDGSNFHFWLLEDHSKKFGVPWILKHTISINNLARDPLGDILCSFQTFMPYALHPTSEVVFLGAPVLIVSYHPEGNRLEQVCRLEYPKLIIWGQHTVYPYSRCLVSLKDSVTRHHGSKQLGIILGAHESSEGGIAIS